ncbi:hypothetical protein LCGC14_0992470 [marine sediment metagenome]|uniref:5'-3' exonuclease domain-containing protein n=1 Tax=marine sediment metagenome TaxID=412755 RepID=A0A0F9NRZ4_9ZZZZ
MRILQQRDAVLLIDLSNFVARAIAVAQQDYLRLVLQMLLKLRRHYPHHRFVFAVEGAGTLRRQRLLPCYKEGRVPSPEFNEARQVAIQMLRRIECQHIKAPDGEADDAIATYVGQHPDDNCVIVSNDRDLWQLITPNCNVWATVKRNNVQVDRFACRRLLGVDPKVVPLMKALLGDASDNIPRGVARVHKKKLLRLVNDSEGRVDQIPQLVQDAEYLTVKDKEKIILALPTVKQHLSVTIAWNNLSLKTRTCSGDVEALTRFLDHYGATTWTTVDEIEIIVGMVK